MASSQTFEDLANNAIKDTYRTVRSLIDVDKTGAEKREEAKEFFKAAITKADDIAIPLIVDYVPAGFKPVLAYLVPLLEVDKWLDIAAEAIVEWIYQNITSPVVPDLEASASAVLKEESKARQKKKKNS